MAALNVLPFEKFSQLTESLINEMSGFIPEPWQNIVSNLDWTKQDSITIKKEITKIIVEIMYYTDSQKLDILNKIFDSDKSTFLVELIAARKVDITKALMKQHNASIKPILDDFDWKVKWILGNSSSTVMKYPLVNLDIYTLCHDKKSSDVISVELTKSELDNLIEMLEQQYNTL